VLLAPFRAPVLAELLQRCALDSRKFATVRAAKISAWSEDYFSHAATFFDPWYIASISLFAGGLMKMRANILGRLQSPREMRLFWPREMR
jgi:hypothetical protein